MKSPTNKKALVLMKALFVTFGSKWWPRLLLPPTNAKNLQNSADQMGLRTRETEPGVGSPGCNQELRGFLILSHLASSPEHFYLMSYESENTCSDRGQNESIEVTSRVFFPPTLTVRSSLCFPVVLQVFLVRKVTPPDANQLYAMKVLKKATLKGTPAWRNRLSPREQNWMAGWVI